MEEKRKINLKQLLSSDKGRIVLIAIGIIAMFLIFLSSRGSDSQDINTESFDTKAYHTELTSQIENMVESIEGAGETKVLLTLENSYEYVYLEDGRTLQKVNEPVIRGVVVACEGGTSAVVCSKITEILTTALNVSSAKVCVSKLT